MPKNKKIIATLLVVLIFIIEGAFAAEDTFKGSITGSSGGLGNIGEGIFPFSVSWSKNKDITILDEDEYDKAHLVFSFSSSVTRDRDYGYNPMTGAPSWLETLPEGQGRNYNYYFKPSASINVSLSQKFEKWTLKGTINTKYAHLMEDLVSGVPSSLYFFNSDGKVINDIAAEGMIGILRPLGLSK